MLSTRVYGPRPYVVGKLYEPQEKGCAWSPHVLGFASNAVIAVRMIF